MDGQNYVVFHNDSDSSYMNSSANFRGAEIGAAQEIDLYFASALSTAPSGGSYDRVRLHVTAAGNEEKALVAIGQALSGGKIQLLLLLMTRVATTFQTLLMLLLALLQLLCLTNLFTKTFKLLNL